MNKAFEKVINRFKQLQGCDSLANMFIRDVIKVIKSIEKEYNNGWIPVSERLPDDGTIVLLQDYKGYYELGSCKTRSGIKGFENGDWWSSANNYIAWQQLPEPYKENEY